jgi:hypothetical protein
MLVLHSLPIRNEQTTLQAAVAPQTGAMILYGVENKKRISHLAIG